MGRKRGIDFNDTTLETFKRVTPYTDYVLRWQDKEIIIDDTAKVAFGGLDDQETINKFNSAEYCFLALDQAEETLKKDVEVLQASLRFKLNGKQPPYKELYTANPAECWLKDDFVIGQREGGIFIPALPDDNPYLPDNYKQTLKSAFKDDPILLAAYLEGDWDAFSNTDDALIQPRYVNEAREVEVDEDRFEEESIRIVAADIATKRGENETVVVYRVGHTIKEVYRYKNAAATVSAFKIKELKERKNANIVVVDSDGFGEGVSDLLEASGVGVTEFHGGYTAKAVDNRRYRNLRSQFHDILVKKIEKGMISLKEVDIADFNDFKRQICSIKIKPPDGMMRMQVETKDDMHGRGIKSPDISDAIVYSEYGHFIANTADLGPYSYK